MIGLAVLCLIVGILAVAGSAGDWRRRQRIVGTPTTPIAHARGDSVVEVKGRVVPGEQGTFVTPFSGRQAVFCCVRVQEYRKRGRRKAWHDVVVEIEARDFYIDDASGQLARIVARSADMLLDKASIASSGTFKDPPPHLATFLQARGVSTSTWLGFNRALRYLEEVLAPGDAVYALGPSHREAGPPVQDGYRMSPSSRLVMSGMGKGDLELLVSNKPEEELTRNLGMGMLIGVILLAGSVLFGIGGVVSRLIR